VGEVASEEVGADVTTEIILGFVDYENFRMAFRNYSEYLEVEDIIKAFEDLGSELGELRTLFFYGDWTRRSQDARAIEDHGHRAINVLSTRFGRDRSDFPMGFDMYDHARDDKDVTAFILGSGDSGFKEAILRCRQHGKRIYVLCFGSSASRELFTSTNGVYPLESRLSLTEKPPLQATMPGVESIEHAEAERNLIAVVDSLEKTLAYVVRSYLRDKVLLPRGSFGETSEEVDDLLARMISEDILRTEEIPNPKIAGRTVSVVRLNRDHLTVKGILPSGQNNGEADEVSASP
jgi:uncharacterized LabA/DUF88 family protein